MLILNGKKFARDDSEFISTLFQPDGTAVGYFKPMKSEIRLLNARREHIGTINQHGVLCAATTMPNGRTWYSFADIAEIGRYASYTQSVDEPRAALRAHCPAA